MTDTGGEFPFEPTPPPATEPPPTPPLPSGRPSRAECSATHRVERGAVLVCNWAAGHGGDWHWDQGDQVIWETWLAGQPTPIAVRA